MHSHNAVFPCTKLSFYQCKPRLVLQITDQDLPDLTTMLISAFHTIASRSIDAHQSIIILPIILAVLLIVAVFVCIFTTIRNKHQSDTTYSHNIHLRRFQNLCGYTWMHIRYISGTLFTRTRARISSDLSSPSPPRGRRRTLSEDDAYMDLESGPSYRLPNRTVETYESLRHPPLPTAETARSSSNSDSLSDIGIQSFPPPASPPQVHCQPLNPPLNMASIAIPSPVCSSPPFNRRILLQEAKDRQRHRTPSRPTLSMAGFTEMHYRSAGNGATRQMLNTNHQEDLGHMRGKEAEFNAQPLSYYEYDSPYSPPFGTMAEGKKGEQKSQREIKDGVEGNGVTEVYEHIGL